MCKCLSITKICGYTALIAAAGRGHLEIVNTLIKNGANVNHENQIEETALIFAAKNGHLDVVKTLLINSANVNCIKEKGCNALMWAAKNGHLDVVKTLLAHNTNIDAVDVNGNTAKSFATKYNHWQIKKIIIELNSLKRENLLNPKKLIKDALDKGANGLIGNKFKENLLKYCKIMKIILIKKPKILMDN